MILSHSKTYKENNLERAIIQQGNQDNIGHSAKILESDKIGLDLIVNENPKEITIEFTDEPGFVDPRDLAWRQYQLDMQRSESNTSHHENLINLHTPPEGDETDYTQVEKSKNTEFSKSTTQMLEPLKDNWSITMKALLTDREKRFRRLEEGFATVNASKLRLESLEREVQGECLRLSSVSKKNEDILPGLFSMAQASSLRVKSVELNVQRRLAWLR